MKQRLISLERTLLRAAPVGLLVRIFVTLGFRLRWLWGRVSNPTRRAALAQRLTGFKPDHTPADAARADAGLRDLTSSGLPAVASYDRWINRAYLK
ncbi:hypothetical protein [Pseudophaeobacter arcticus]|jgi:hypothetical protein|uniref:hypothetical protein n=1 Tax=Pseudophaeobacter arcticus TaxID=385492 RepID=UPI0003FF42F2|nr:hypothetical protein [Pseudophaeobacter arcticus]